MPDLNFRKKIIDISKILKSWQHRKLTLLGKVTVIKTLALPKLIHKELNLLFPIHTTFVFDVFIFKPET
jgi:hypothetical protein